MKSQTTQELIGNITDCTGLNYVKAQRLAQDGHQWKRLPAGPKVCRRRNEEREKGREEKVDEEEKE